MLSGFKILEPIVRPGLIWLGAGLSDCTGGTSDNFALVEVAPAIGIPFAGAHFTGSGFFKLLETQPIVDSKKDGKFIF